MAFPISPSIGTKYTNASSITYEFVTPGVWLNISGFTDFIALGDTPSSYATAGFLVKINATATGLDFIDPSAYTLTDGSGTTANGTAVDLGGTLTSDVVIDGGSGGAYSVTIGNNTAAGYLASFNLNAQVGSEIYSGPYPSNGGQDVTISTNPGGRTVTFSTSTVTNRYQINPAYFEVFYNGTTGSSTLNINADYDLTTNDYTISSNNFDVSPTAINATIVVGGDSNITNIIPTSTIETITSATHSGTFTSQANLNSKVHVTGTISSLVQQDPATIILSTAETSSNTAIGTQIDLTGIFSEAQDTVTLQKTNLDLSKSAVSLRHDDGASSIGSLNMGDDSIVLSYNNASGNGYVTLQSASAEIGVTNKTFLSLTDTSAIFTDSTTTGAGLQYAADYSATYVDRSLVDKAYVDSHATNIANTDLTQTDLVRTYNLPTAIGTETLDFVGGSDNQIRLLGNVDISQNVAVDGTGVETFRAVSLATGNCELRLRGNAFTLQTVSDTIFNIASTNTSYGKIEVGVGVLMQTRGTAGATSLAGPEIRFYDRTLTTQYAKFDINGRFLYGDTSFVGDEDFSIQGDTLIKGSDDSLNTKIFHVINDSEDDLFNIRGNGQSCFGGPKVNNTAHIFYNPSNQASSLARFIDNSGTVGINLATNGRIETSNSTQGLIFRTYATGGVPHIELYHHTKGQIVDLQSGSSHIDATALAIGGQASKVGAKFTLLQASTNTSQQKFFANITSATAGRLGSDTGFGADQKGFESFDTDLDRKFVWNGVEWKSIAWLSDFEVGTTVKTSTSTGVSGETSYNSGFLYTCVATDTWVRSAVDTVF